MNSVQLRRATPYLNLKIEIKVRLIRCVLVGIPLYAGLLTMYGDSAVHKSLCHIWPSLILARKTATAPSAPSHCVIHLLQREGATEP